MHVQDRRLGFQENSALYPGLNRSLSSVQLFGRTSGVMHFFLSKAG